MKTMSYRADETPEQKNYKLQAIEFVRLAAERARKRQAVRESGFAFPWISQDLSVPMSLEDWQDSVKRRAA